jgi:hypothetical protein
VTQMAAEKRGYMRGYNRGRMKAWSAFSRIVEISKGWRAKAAEGFGGARCDTSANWTRGLDGRAKWGTCSQNWLSSPELGCIWAEGEDSQANPYLVSHENFACINWRPEKKL